MKLLITGATGYIGSNLLKRLKGNEVHIIVRKNSDVSKIENGIKIFIDENEELLEYFLKNRFDGIIHLAAISLKEHTFNDIHQLINSNLNFATRILDAASESGVNWFINTGTFWQNNQDEHYSPANLYAATKQAFETLAQYYIEKNKIKFCTIRLNNTYGPNDPRPKILNLWSKIAKTGEPLDMTLGNQYINMTYIDDVIDAYLLLIQSLNTNGQNFNNGDIFFLKSEENYTIKELASIYEKISKRKLNINWGKIKTKERDYIEISKKVKLVPGWKPKVTIEEGIRRILTE